MHNTYTYMYDNEIALKHAVHKKSPPPPPRNYA